MEAVKVTMCLCAFLLSIHTSVSALDLNALGSQNFISPHKNNMNCNCFPKNQVHTSVPNILDPEGNGLERLVVFMYLDPNTKKVNLYTPNANIQKTLPDIPYEAHDDILLDMPETVRDVFNHNPNKIILDPVNYIDPIDSEPVDMEPVDMNNINIGEIKDFENYYSLPAIEMTGISDIGVNPALELESYVAVKPPVHTIKTPAIPSLENIDIILDVASEVPPTTNHKINSVKKPFVIHPYVDISYMERPTEAGNIFVNNPDIDHESYVAHVFNPMTANRKNPTFEHWFMSEMRKFQNVQSPGGLHNIDVKALKSIVEKTLLENRIIITHGGGLIDSEGHIFNITDLKLRPVLLGSPVEYYNVILESATHFNLPKDLPYLQCLLILLGDPPKVLFLIPLGKTLDRPKVAVGSPSVIALNPKTSRTWQTLNRPIITHGYLPSKLLAAGIHEIGKINHESYYHRLPTDNKLYYNVKSDEHSHVGSVENIYDMLSHPLTRQDSSIMDAKGYNTSDKNNITDTEPPGFRIIGGSAATGSGTPLNNKGRSGLNI